jgi:Cys-tRNA(Pro)/Cys-tRNA(Cys) deacylase
MARSTPATVALTKAGIAFTLHEYDYDPNAERIGMQAAEALGVSPARLLKTLMAKRATRLFACWCRRIVK